MKIEIDLDGYTESQFLDRLSYLVLEKVKGSYEDSLDHKIEALLREKVENAVDVLIEEGVRAKVEEVLAAGVRIGGQYNRSEPISVADVLRKKLEEPHSNGYDRGQQTLAETIAKKVLDEALSKDLRAELDAIRAKFKAQVDGVLAAKLLEIVRSVEK